MKRASWWTTALACAALVATVEAQTMYKCGKQYQDRPCDAGQAGTAMGAPGASRPAGASSDAECAQRGSDAQKVAWSREGGATVEKLFEEIDAKSVSSSRKAEEKKLVRDVYEKRGSAPQIRAAIEADCLAEKEKVAQAAALAAAAAKLAPASPAAPAEPSGTPQVTAVQERGAADASAGNKALCRSLGADLERNRASQRSGASAASMEKLRDSARKIEAQMRDAGC